LCWAITPSKKYLGENGSARPATRLTAIKAKPRISSPLRGLSSARISGSAFQVSAADFLGLLAVPASEAAGVAPREGVLSPPIRVVGLPGSFGTMFFRCSDLEDDYSAAGKQRPESRESQQGSLQVAGRVPAGALRALLIL